jgi:aryl-alcohol dehydrogenase (NADP+)
MKREIQNSLNRLQMDFVDLYQIHRWDPQTDIELVLRTLNHFIDEGLAIHIGASSMYTWQFAKAQFLADNLGLERFVTMQNHYNAIYREEEREMIPFCLDQKIGVIPWSPLARGFLSGKYNPDSKDDYARIRSDPYLRNRYFRKNDFEVLKVISSIAKEENISIPQVALSWLLGRNGVTAPIIGVTKIQHLEEAVEAVDISLNQDFIKRIDEVYRPHPIIGHSYNQPDSMIHISR